jgi:CheY-like chemotaxis protein
MERALSRSLLIVDDELPLLMAMKDYFTHFAYDVDCATELEEAVALIEHRRYGLLICDLRLNGTSDREGLNIVSMMRQSSRSARIVLLTAHNSPDLAHEASQLGVHLLVNKPIPLPHLRELIESLTD